MPSQVPSAKRPRPSGCATTMTRAETGRALLRRHPAQAFRASSAIVVGVRRVLAGEARRTDARAHRSSASTSSPESSARAGRFACRASARAFSSALARYVAPLSSTTGALGTSSRPTQLDAGARRAGPRARAACRGCASPRASSGAAAHASATAAASVALLLRASAAAMPFAASARHLAQLRAAVNGALSAVPCTSTYCPLPVMTKFMSTSARLSSS